VTINPDYKHSIDPVVFKLQQIKLVILTNNYNNNNNYYYNNDNNNENQSMPISSSYV